MATGVPQNPDNPQVEPVAGSPAKKTGENGGAKLNGPLKPMAEPKPSVTGIDRPPGPPKRDCVGAYLQFTGTDNESKLWTGSALTLHRKGTKTPSLTFDRELVAPATEHAYDLLYENVFGWTALRWNLIFRVPDGAGDELVKWTLTHGDTKDSNVFHIARWQSRWRGGAFSCNGFDETVPDDTIKNFGFDGVWKHLNSINDLTPMHVLCWGGDQIYIDLIFQDVPWLADWLKLPWEEKWSHELPQDASEQVAQYYFYSYCANWERPEVRHALAKVPAVMQWDDHDIFDGAQSYPEECRQSPVMTGLVRSAQKMRLLFQHHTTPELGHTKHGLWGQQGYNAIIQCGPYLAMLNPDGRTERSLKQVMDSKTWDMIFDRLDQIPDTTQHLIAVFAVPFSFIRLKAAEALFKFLANRAPWVRKLPGIKSMNSIFDLPEFLDDLADEYCHGAHIAERDRGLTRLQQFAEKHSCRVTMISGDVHCAATSRFRSDHATRQRERLTPATDPRLMMSFISSAIVNQAPSKNALIAYHYVGNKWHPIEKTDEELVEMFERRPEGGAHVRHRKFMPNRNWLYFEMVGEGTEASAATPGAPSYVVQADDPAKHHHFRHHKHSRALLDWSREHYAFDRERGYPSTIGPSSSKEGKGAGGKPLHEHKHGFFCHHRKSRALNPTLETKAAPDAKDTTADTPARRQMPNAPTGLLVRFWLESRKKETTKTRQFSSYQVCVPDLVVGPKGTARKRSLTGAAAPDQAVNTSTKVSDSHDATEAAPPTQTLPPPVPAVEPAAA